MKVNIGPYEGEDRIIEIEIDNYDTWNLDHTFSLIAIPLLEKYKEDVLKDRFIPSGNGNVHYLPDDDDEAEEKNNEWIEIIDKMIYAFKGVVDNPDFIVDYDSISHEEAKEKGYDLIDVEDLGLDITPFYVDREAQRIHDSRVREGLELFGKYFQHLWT